MGEEGGGCDTLSDTLREGPVLDEVLDEVRECVCLEDEHDAPKGP